ncbi:MAG TPA: hypothetical protein VGK13_03480 [Methanocellaceae archaeon]
MPDLVAVSSYALAIIALAYFTLEFIFTGVKDRIYKAIKTSLQR